jgi:hypothetical protein
MFVPALIERGRGTGPEKPGNRSANADEVPSPSSSMSLRDERIYFERLLLLGSFFIFFADFLIGY